MSRLVGNPLLRHIFFMGCAALFVAPLAVAQATAATDFTAPASTAPASTAQTNWSSSQTANPFRETLLAGAAMPASPAASAMPSAPAAAAQDNNNYSGWHPHNLTHRLTFEAGAGFNAPIGNDTPFITWGGNFTLGAGVRWNKVVSTLVEYQFMDNKLPGALIAAADSACTSQNGGTDCGITAGDSHINSITGSPVIDLTPNRSNGIYLVGGWGWYHKSTNFNEPQLVFSPFYGYYYANFTALSFTSNQWGGNGGIGIYHRVGSMYGTSHTQIFAEARYTYIHTPPITQNNGFGTTELIPVTLGVRF